MEADQGQDDQFLVFAIVMTTCALAWFFNENLEAALGLKSLLLLRFRTQRELRNGTKKNSRGFDHTTDPMRLPVTAIMFFLIWYHWWHKYFETAMYFALLALFLRLYLVAEMWTRGISLLRWPFDYLDIRTNYFEPVIFLLDIAFITGNDKFWALGVTIVFPWCFVSLNPDIPLAAVITWSMATSCVLVSRYSFEWTVISGLQLAIVVQPVTLMHNHVLRAEAEQATRLAQDRADSEANHTQFIAHEVRNPLSVAVGGLSFVEERVSALQASAPALEPILADIRMARSSMQFVDSLLTNMLDLAKSQAGELGLEMKRCSLLLDVLEPTVSMMASRSQNVKLSVETQEPLWVDADALRLKQVMVNLVKNALKFVPSGWVRVGALRDGDMVRLWVADTGPGIPTAMHLKLFRKFTQLGTHDQGTGIGLCVCQQIAQRMGGSIEIDPAYRSGSPEGPGSKFVVAVRLAAVTPPSPATSPRPHAPPSTRVRGRRRVLVVDDDELVRQTLRRTFEAVSDGWVLDEATDGESCLALAAQHEYDIITIDHHLDTVRSDKDDMKGTDLVQELRRMGIRAYLIGCSGNDVSAQYSAAGADAFWSKPFPTGRKLVRALAPLPLPVHWRVLIAEDQMLVRRLLARKLKRALPHVVVSEAPTGSLAADLIRSSPFDLMVFDQHLEDDAGLQGTDLARLARTCGSKAIIAGFSANPMREEHLAAGCDLSWDKVISIKQIRESLLGCTRGCGLLAATGLGDGGRGGLRGSKDSKASSKAGGATSKGTLSSGDRQRLELSATLAYTKPPDCGHESSQQIHLRIGSTMAADAQLRELQKLEKNGATGRDVIAQKSHGSEGEGSSDGTKKRKRPSDLNMDEVMVVKKRNPQFQIRIPVSE